MRIPFDAICVNAAVRELQSCVGSTVVSVRPNRDAGLVIEVQGESDSRILVSWSSKFARVHLLGRRKSEKLPQSHFVEELKRRIVGARIDKIQQVRMDRVVFIELRTQTEQLTLMFEILGARANLYLVRDNRILLVARSMKKNRVGETYSLPEQQRPLSLLDVTSQDQIRDCEGSSPFLQNLVAAGLPLQSVQGALRSSKFEPVIVDSVGCYPLTVSALGLHERRVSSFSLAAEIFFDSAEINDQIEEKRRSLIAKLQHVLQSRQKSLDELDDRIRDAKNVAMWQLKAELLLAYSTSVDAGATTFEATTYEGDSLLIELDGELTPVENAEKFFKRARKARESEPLIRQQRDRIESSLEEVASVIHKCNDADLASLQSLEQVAIQKKWLLLQVPPQAKQDRPYEGKRVREFIAEGGWLILVGENAEANDYLTVRVAKPDDWWLHVRGASSAHVIIPTRKKPETVPRSVLQFAAELAARFSSQKHAGIVPVDYTLKKYVRRVRSAPLGTVRYEREKTIHIEKKI